ncbi:hypothetical protein [Hansschlegelia sp.]|uniref:hypothetical protein n=1 Tax=Hansschlegelia sp. TaxID=2041892 RepID=UPI002C05E6C7|nr:hypothetical protein [Hansschlegelia sp.]HVI28414.1 hypothetical protein [Hansschlegelia sp.]
MSEIVAEVAAPPAPPQLDIELLKADVAHLCAGVKKVSGGIEISALCQPAARKSIAAIHAVSDNSFNLLFFQSAPKVEGLGLSSYSVLVPRALLSRKLSFQIINQNGDVYPAFTASRRKLKLPANWQFSPYFLNLTHDPSAEGKSVAPAPAGAFIRAFAVAQDNLEVDLTVFLSGTGEDAPQRATLAISRDGSDIFETDFDLQPAKKVFRAAAAMHKQYTNALPFHGELSVPIMTAFAERGLYDLEVKVGSDRASIRPYNRYYFQKPAVLMAEGDLGTHVIRHFADPATGNIRMWLE